MQNLAQKQCEKCGWMGSNIGRKQLIGLTGLGLSLFLFDPHGGEYADLRWTAGLQ